MVLSSTESVFDPTDTSSDSSANFSPPNSIVDIQSAYFCNDSSESSDISDVENINIAEFLKQWYHDNSVSVSLDALSSLLKGLKRWFPQLPATARTLLKTPRNVETIKMGEGEYFNFGLVKSLNNHLDKMTNKNSINHINLNFNIDGLPLYKSTNQQFWPLLCSIQEDCERKPFLVSIFCGNSKPPLEQFLGNFIEELNKILQEGLMFGSIKINVSVRCISCIVMPLHDHL